MFAFARLAGYSLILAATLASAASAQGSGATGAQVLQLTAGGRAAGLAGAYSAVSSDVDALFYNPAGAAGLRYGAALAYESLVEDIALASFAGVLTAGRFTLGFSALFLDQGSVAELVPAPEFGGNTGKATGKSVSASEGIARLSVATRIGHDLRIGAAAGLLSSSIADYSSNAPSFDLGAQYDLAFGTIAASLRNVGGSLSGDDVAEAELPTEARLGAALRMERASGLAAALTADLLARLREGSTGVLIGGEAGLRATATRPLGVLARVGFSGADGADALGALRLGAGISLGDLAVDYAYQNLEFFGAVHRFGVRWSIAR